MPHNLPYAHEHPPLGFVDAIDALKPHVLIGATGCAGYVHPGGRRADVRDQRASRPVRALEPDVESGMHGRAGLRVEPRPRRLRQRQPVRPGDVRWPRVSPRTGQQRVRVPRHRTWRHRLPRPAHPRRVLPGRRAHARGSGHCPGSPRGSLYPPLRRHPPDFARDRRQRGRSRLCDEARPREAAAEHQASTSRFMYEP